MVCFKEDMLYHKKDNIRKDCSIVSDENATSIVTRADPLDYCNAKEPR
jgi:hypothetical protein